VSTIFPDLQGKNVLITGGADGIGEAVARAFVDNQSRVSILDKDAERGRSLAEELNQQRDLATFYEVDLTDEKQLVDVLRRTDEERGCVDVLINNAAYDPRIDLLEQTAEQWDELFALNVRHYFLTCRELLPRMIERGQGGSIVMASSICHFITPPDVPCYTATKSAILGLVRSLGRQLGRHRIRVNAVAPGWIMTERQKRDWVTPAIEEKIKHEWQSLPKLLTPEDVTPAFLFLASDASRAMTRQTLLVDGGWAFTCRRVPVRLGEPHPAGWVGVGGDASLC